TVNQLSSLSTADAQALLFQEKLIFPSSSKIKTADNTISMVVGKTEKIKLDIQDHEDNDGLLGLDWFMQTGASLNPSQKLIKFPSDIILMNSDEDEMDNYINC
ncbi:hypothetical protein BpHYR1_015521, partial [Brachionus plicatilis]